MKLPKEKSAAAARESKRRLENPVTEAQKVKKQHFRPNDYVRFNERHIEIVRDLELWRRDEEPRGLKG